MFNLLPQQQKKVIAKEYSTRKLIVWLGLVFTILLVSLIMLMPSYLLSRMRAGEAETNLKNTKTLLEGELETNDVTSEISTAIQNAQLLRPFRQGVSAYDTIRIFEGKPATIKITEVTFSNPGKDSNGVDIKPQMIVQGKAATRESITSFGKLLESREEFESVEIPVSSFVKDSNIDFSMTVILK